VRERLEISEAGQDRTGPDRPSGDSP
jgi:hypothetical protein